VEDFDEIAKKADQKIVNILLQFIAECQEKDAESPMVAFLALTIHEGGSMKIAFKSTPELNNSALVLLGGAKKAVDFISDSIHFDYTKPLL